MSRATKRKHVLRELLEERVRPGPRQRIVRVLGTPGNNLHEVETAEGTRFLASMPPRFRRHIWIKRGDFLLVDPIEEGDKVKAEMSLVLLPPHIRFLQCQGLWPEAFAPRESRGPPGDEDDGLFVNTNRAGTGEDTGDSEDSSDEDTGDSEDTGDKEDTSDEEKDAGDKDTGDKEEDSSDKEEAGGDEEDAGDKDTGSEEDTGDNSDTEKDRGDKSTHPRACRAKDRGDGGTQDTRCSLP